MSTAARVATEQSSHWYFPNGQPCYELPKKDGSGKKNPTLADARKLDLIPSVTTILRILDKPNLNDWKVEQGVLAVLSTPRKEGEELDAFVRRVLYEERVQDEEAAKARGLGTAIHDALEKGLNGLDYDPLMEPFVAPVLQWRMGVGKVLWTERIMVGDGYAGKADALIRSELLLRKLLVDFKTTGKLPKESYYEHRLQTAAYAACVERDLEDADQLITTNVYISTKEPGQFVVYSQDNWAETYVNGFEHLLKLWQHMNHYIPNQQP